MHFSAPTQSNLMYLSLSSVIFASFFNDSTFLLQRLCQREQCKLAYKLPSAANLLQRYAFLLKEARNFGKMFESEGDKKKKVYPRLPDMLGKKDTP